MDLDALRSEIEDDPAALGYAPHVAAGRDADIADLLSEGRGDVQTFVPMAELENWLLVTGKLLQVEAAAAAEGPLQAPGLLVLRMLASPRLTGIMLSNPQVQAVMGAFQAAGIMTPEDLDTLAGLGTSRQPSRAEALFGEGTVITHGDVARALRGGGGA